MFFKRGIGLLAILLLVLFAVGCQQGAAETDIVSAQSFGESTFQGYLDDMVEEDGYTGYQILSGTVEESTDEDIDYIFRASADLTRSDGQTDKLDVVYHINVDKNDFKIMYLDKQLNGAGTLENDASGSGDSQEETTEESNTVRVTIREGWSVEEIFAALEENGVCSAEELFDACQNYEFTKYPLVLEIPENENRCFRLEGYLFPDTYEFYKNSSPENAIAVFLRNTENKITEEIRQQAADQGLTVYELLTIASLIEKEGANPDEMPKIASVIYNRLEEGMKLELDATITYIEKHVKPFIDGDQDRYNEYYNTYKCSALPAGPIANPGMNAINAALNPADTNYYYFLTEQTDSGPVYYYAETFDEHQANREKTGV